MNKALLNSRLLQWYKKNYRRLPWRNTSDPYRIWLSEIILQQTRVAQGLPYYEKFVRQFPSIRDLAEASEEKILRSWQGLGYYTRATNMHRCARIIVTAYKGKFPDSFEELTRLPGIGTYTAAAIASMAFRAPVAVVDGNVFRVFSRLFGIFENIHSVSGKKTIRKLAERYIHEHDPGTFNQAMMEFGALVCTPKKPGCDQCPFNEHCFAFRNGKQLVLPVSVRTKKSRLRYFNYFIVRERDTGKYFMVKRDDKDIWKGLYEFLLVESPGNKTNNRGREMLPGLTEEDYEWTGVEKKHVLTHQVIMARFYHLDKENIPVNISSSVLRKGEFFTPGRIRSLPKPILIEKYLKEEIF